MIVLAVMAAGALGAGARFVLDGAVKSRRATTFPWATLAINVSGSFLLGLIAGAVMFGTLDSDAQAVVGTGFCGGFTTFSTASFETVRLAEKRRSLSAAANALASVVGSAVACAAGLVLASAV
ncbi:MULTISPECIES: fluoride efflux transporter CrcB [Gordonia]|uniref:Fluoride-specific ion channel FluC n=1 Tax=Gordonia tangerina TaxID=2911060 RepID=A0ABS9DKT6_9ACTN|nr:MULTISPECIES: fluoride efflux transporter CrcB [Gordonia]MAU84775.1 fluoride efflux transporter CrcB [Gordonia sp. (in: high G+C Gram-positive bacteria)]MCF3939844.1 fluoride efflux transporter CrcB [Gordonia tangerina]